MKYADIETSELLKKYRVAGKIRFLSFFLLFLFLLLMRAFGGYSYLNTAFISLILVEAIINQPYAFIIKRVNVHRLKYYQMTTDIIAISWVLYYMGGIEAPIVIIAYYAIILWAGIAFTVPAVFFAVFASSFFFAFIVIFEYFGYLPPVSYYGYQMPAVQMISLLTGNIAFLFAFGYFSAYSSRFIRSLQIKRQEETLRGAHKLMATGHLVGRTAHDLLNVLNNADGYTKILQDQTIDNADRSETLKAIENLHKQSFILVNRLGSFSQENKGALKPIDVHKAIDDALELANPILRYTKIIVEKIFDIRVPLINTNGNELQEAFLVFILNSIDAISKEGKLIIRTDYLEKEETINIVFSDTGIGIKQEDLNKIGEMFFTTKEAGKGSGMGLMTAYAIIKGGKGRIDVESVAGKGTTFSIRLPVK